MLKVKIFSTINGNAQTSTKKKKKKKNLTSLVLKKDIILLLFVFVGKWLHLNVFRNNKFEYL